MTYQLTIAIDFSIHIRRCGVWPVVEVTKSNLSISLFVSSLSESEETLRLIIGTFIFSRRRNNLVAVTPAKF